jgi:hypothetical protein
MTFRKNPCRLRVISQFQKQTTTKAPPTLPYLTDNQNTTVTLTKKPTKKTIAFRFAFRIKNK